MISGRDSAYPPSDAVLAAAAQAGVGAWFGYFAGPNILNGWAKTDFDRVKAHGMVTLAYCSGWSDPAAMRAQSLAWGVPICLDDESGLRPDGQWVQGWLDISGAGLYGNWFVHNRNAPFHILAAYPTSGDPFEATWNTQPRPPGPCGWQWCGTHPEFGASCDSAFLDPWFAGLHGGGGGTLSTSLSPKEAISIVSSSTSVNLFGRATDEALWQLRFDGTSWQPWRSLGGRLIVPQVDPIQTGERIDVFAISDGNHICRISSLDSGATWGPWEDVQGVFDGDYMAAISGTPDSVPAAQKAIMAAIAAIPGASPIDISGLQASLTALKTELDQVALSAAAIAHLEAALKAAGAALGGA